MQELSIESYSDQYQLTVQQLILDIQRNEFQVDIDLERQPDLSDIPGFYQKGSGNFWVATIDETVIGSIALLDLGNRMAALRKMFVHRDFRGKEHKIGQQLLDTLLAHARADHLEAVYLGTTEKFIAAQRFYEKNGFVELAKSELPVSFPVMAVDVKFYRHTFDH